jgi:C3HC4-type zinc finger (RING finger) protein
MTSADLMKLPSAADALKKLSTTVSNSSRGAFCRMKVARFLTLIRALSLGECTVFFSSYPTHVLRGFSVSEALEVVTKAFVSGMSTAHPTAWALSFDDLVVWKEFNRVVGNTIPFFIDALDLNRSLRCLICDDAFDKSPAVMCCGHSICYGCLFRVNSCPFCRLPVMGDEKPNYALCKILEKYEQFTTDSEVARNQDVVIYLSKISQKLSENCEKQFMSDILSAKNVTRLLASLVAALAMKSTSINNLELRTITAAATVVNNKGWKLKILDLMTTFTCEYRNLEVRNDTYLEQCGQPMETIYSAEDLVIFAIFIRGLTWQTAGERA